MVNTLMMGMFVNGRKSPGLCVVWQGGTGFSINRLTTYEGEVTVHNGALQQGNIDLRGKVTLERVAKHVEDIFDKLSKDEIRIKDLD